ncbi:alpha/beta hydrolase [Pelomonas sp. APW6]|uniref:Alpha/beta hydrolase n=1 Tax=Roseateles subflavus TaxID=3053353 RepID=A0ABT7LFW7_9BURK|nr:alpha/beta hydrolase [Pelomonas sp. APW6]MDL5030540.1 alpha/beta hydrolase [Pelomonas sp. APW6]
MLPPTPDATAAPRPAPTTPPVDRGALARLLLPLAAALMGGLGLLAGCTGVPPTVAEREDLPRAHLDGHWVHTEAFGAEDRPVVLVLHGGSGADYRYLLGLQALSDDYRVVFYDQLGSGLTERVPAADITVARFLAELHAVVEHHAPGRPVHLLGHSWGAMLATAYAGAHPERVRSLVLAEPGFLEQDSLRELDALGGGWPGWRGVLGVSQAWLGQWFVRTDGDAHARQDWMAQRLLPLFQAPASLCHGQLPALQGWRGGHAVFRATVARMGEDPAFAASLDFTQGLAAYTGPVLFVRGACNQAQGEAHQRRMMARFAPASRAGLATLEGAGHFMFNDQPAASLAVVRRFLGSPCRAGSGADLVTCAP